MLVPLAALFLAAVPSPAADSAAHDTLPSRRIVREFEPVTVFGDRLSDPRSIESVQRIDRESIRRLAVDRLVEAVGLQAGVVAIGGDLHVRGGRAGELVVSIAGVPLNEPGRGTPMEVPLFAVRAAELITGSLDADHTGSLAGELDLQTEQPGAQRSALLRWLGDGRLDTGYDAVHARASGPLWRGGPGLAVAGEVRLDDLGLPVTRSRGRTNILGATFGWKQDNRLLGWAKLVPPGPRSRASLEVLASRVIRQPYNPMFDFDGWVSFQPDPQTGEIYTGRPLATADRQLDGTYFRYRAGDHAVMTEERRLAAIATLAGGGAHGSQRLALGWTHTSQLASVGLRRDDAYIRDANRPVFGPYDYAWADPFHAYFGDEPYFRDAGSGRWFARADAARRVGARSRLRFGAGLTYESVRLREFDDAAPEIRGVDTVRSFRAWAPGAFAYVQHRWEFEGLAWNAGLRVSSFTAGPQAPPPYVAAYQRTPGSFRAPTIWSWSPRLGFTYPVSDRDVFSLSYARIFQDPPRDLLYESRLLSYGRRPLGNGQMAPSEVISYQAAVKHVLDPRWSLQVAAFFRDVFSQPGTRLIEPVPDRFYTQYASADDAHAGGIELSLRRDWPGPQHLELAYTWMQAWGTQSSLEGLAYGNPVGQRPEPLGQRPLDWDQEHAIALTAHFQVGRDWALSWNTRAASGRPWTPLEREPRATDSWPPLYDDQSRVNSRRLPWSEHTNLSIRFAPPVFFGLAASLSVANLFDEITDAYVTLGGYPNPLIGTLYDQYSAYRTETGNGGGAYWNDVDADGLREWVPVNDPRLRLPRRAIRFGIEVALR